MQRRNFLAALMATATLDPERLLWVPGTKTIFVPTPSLVTVRLNVLTAGGWYIRQTVTPRADVVSVAREMFDDAYNAGAVFACTEKVNATDPDVLDAWWQHRFAERLGIMPPLGHSSFKPKWIVS